MDILNKMNDIVILFKNIAKNHNNWINFFGVKLI